MQIWDSHPGRTGNVPEMQANADESWVQTIADEGADDRYKSLKRSGCQQRPPFRVKLQVARLDAESAGLALYNLAIVMQHRLLRSSNTVFPLHGTLIFLSSYLHRPNEYLSSICVIVD